MKRTILSFMFSLLFFSATCSADETVENVMKKIGLLNQIEITHIRLCAGLSGESKGVLSFSAGNATFAEFLVFTWGEDGKYRSSIPTSICEFSTSDKNSVKLIMKSTALKSRTDSEGPEVPLGVVFQVMANDHAERILVTLTKESRDKLGI